MDAKARGLKKVRVLRWDSPGHVALKVVSLLNQFPEGSSEHRFDITQEALTPEAAWKASCGVTKLNSYSPKYQSAYEEFLLANIVDYYITPHTARRMAAPTRRLASAH